jgi:hypothetical protein
VAAPVRTAPVLLRAITIGVEVVLGLSALYGGIGLLTGTIGMPDTWLEGTPFRTWLVPGIALLLLVAVPMLAATVVELRARRGAEVVSAVAGLMQVGWIAIELLFMHRRYDPLQPLVLILASVLLGAVVLRVRS